LSERRGFAIVLALMAAHVALYETLSVVKFRYYLYRDFDLAIFTQAVNGLLHGTAFSSIRGMNWLGDHSSLILIPLAPLFLIAPHALTLLTLQTVALALGALPLWALARRELPGVAPPLIAVALYLLHPALGYLNLFEFHPETLATPLLIWCACELRGGSPRRGLFAAALALLAREDVALAMLGLAAIVAVAPRHRQPKLAAALALLAIASLALSFGVLRPWLQAGQSEYGLLYARWGATPGAQLLQLITHPLAALAAFWSTPGSPADTLAKREFWLHLFLPASGLALLAPLWLLPSLPILAEHLLSERIHQHAIAFQYTALILPWISVASVIGLGALTRRARGRAWPGVAALLIALACQWMFGPVIGHRLLQSQPRNEAIWPDGEERAMKPIRDAMVARLPRAGALVAGNEFLPGLALRPDVHAARHVVTGHYTASTRAYPPPVGVRALLVDFSAEIPSMDFDAGRRLRAFLTDNGLRPVEAASGTVLMLADTADSLELYRVGARFSGERLDLVADDQLRFVGAERLDSAVARGGLLRVALYWQRVAPANRRYVAKLVWTRDGRIVSDSRPWPLGYGILPPADWPLDSLVREIHSVLVPLSLAPGSYVPAFRLAAVDSSGEQSPTFVRPRPDAPAELMNLVGLGRIVVR